MEEHERDIRGPGSSMSQVAGLPNNSYKPITNTVCHFVNYKKVYTQLAVTSDKVYQLLAHDRWFSPASSTTKTGRHDIADIAESGIKHIKSNRN